MISLNEHASIVYNNIINRRSIRNFKNANIDDKTLQLILDAGNAAPSAGNLKSREILALTTREDIEFVIDYIYSERVKNNLPTFKNAAAIILLLANLQRCRTKYRRGYLYAIQDATLAGQNMLLMASALGLGGCWVGQIKEAKICAKYNITKDFKLVGIIALGKLPQQNDWEMLQLVI